MEQPLKRSARTTAAASNKRPRPKSRTAAPQHVDDRPGADTAAYISDLTAELALMAHKAKLELLAYFLTLAHIEAASTTRAMADEQVVS